MKLASGRISWARVRAASFLSAIGKLGWAAMFIAIGAQRVILVDEFFIGLTGFGSFVLLLLSYGCWFTRGTSPGELEIAGNVLHLPGTVSRVSVPLSRVTSAWVIERRIGGVLYPAVEIEIGGRDVITAHAPDRAQAKAFVDALGYGEKGKRVRIDLSKPTRRLAHLPLGLFSHFLAMLIALITVVPATVNSEKPTADALAFFFIGPISVAIYTLLKRLLRVPEVTIGNDGVEIVGASRRFVARRELAAVSQNVGELPLVLQLRDGSTVPVTAMGMDPERRLAAGRLIEQRLFESTSPPEKTYAFERGSRTIAGWREELGQAMRDTSYRSAGATSDEAQAVLASPLATVEQRVGAALALRVAGEPERVRIAAQATADPRVRIALEAVANDDDGAVEKVLKRRMA